MLALAARDRAALEKVAAECVALGARAEVIVADVAMEDDCRRMVERTVAAFGRIDTLVNNAGATMWARFEDIADMSILERIMQVNYMGAVYCTHHALPHLKASRGRLVGIASLTGAAPACRRAPATRPPSTRCAASSTRCASSWPTPA